MGLEETDVSFDILRVDGGVEITAVIGPESYIYDEFIPIEEGSDYLEFDTVSLFLDGRAFPADIGAMALDFVGIYLYETDKCSQICGYGDQLSGDINQDCYVNLNDFYIMYQDWLEI
jgi:hypothetical protein